MQLTKSSEMLPEFESPTDPTNGGNVNAPFGNENLDHSFKSANSKVVKQSLVCKRCYCSIPENTSNKYLNPSQLTLTEDENAFLCRNCKLYINHANCTEVENEQQLTLSKTAVINTNKKQDKHYCDKCRFTSKDLKQYKKHVSQHEEIKFTCSYCSCVSYTKGEFQRHLVKHTGTFPYKCEYCEYGAVRNDYIVKHTRRVHGSGYEKLASSISEKAEQNSKYQPDDGQGALNDEQLKENSGFQKHLSNSASITTICETTFETFTAITLCYIDDDEPGESPEFDKVASYCDIGDDLHVCEDGSVNVEVPSLERESWQPGTPLTVVASSQLVVPPNSFAQVIEVKMVNGIQKLVLKLFRQQTTNSECTNGNAEECGTFSVNENELITEASLNKMKPLMISYERAEKSNVHDGSNSESERIKNALDSHSCTLAHANKKITVPAEDEQVKIGYSKLSFAKSDLEDEEMYGKENPVNPQMLFTMCQAQKEIFSERSLSVSACSSIYPSSEGQIAQIDFSEISDDTNCEKLPLSTKTVANEKCTDQIHTLSFSARSDSSFSESVLLSKEGNSDISIDNYQSHVPENSLVLESYSQQHLDCISNVTEGPFILSVFSLSSGAQSFPEGIHWDEPVCNMEPTALPHRNVSQIISDVEDLMEPPSTMHIDKCPGAFENLSRLNVHTARDPGKNCSMDTISETVNLGMETDHAGKCCSPSQTHMEVTSEKNCKNTDTPCDIGRHDDLCLLPDAIHATCLKPNGLPTPVCKDKSFSQTDPSQSDEFLLSKNENIADPIKKSKADQVQLTDCKQNEADGITKIRHSDFNAKNIVLHFEKSVLPRLPTGMFCFTEDDSPLLACSNAHAKDVCLPPKTSLEVCPDNSQMSRSAVVNQNADVTEVLMSLPEEVETSCILKQDSFTSEIKQNASQEEHATPNCTTKGEGLNYHGTRPQVNRVESKSRVAQNVPITCPVFIPRGTVLRVLNSTATDTSKETSAYSKHSVYSPHNNETFLPRPVPFHNSVDQSHPFSSTELFARSDCRSNLSQKHTYENKSRQYVSRYRPLVYQKGDSAARKPFLNRPVLLKNEAKKNSSKYGVVYKKIKLQSEQNTQNKNTSVRARCLRLIPVLKEQSIVCPRRNQPVVVLNHPDVDPLEIVNIMKTINLYKGNVRNVILSERTLNCLGVKRRQKRITYKSLETILLKEKFMIKIK